MSDQPISEKIIQDDKFLNALAEAFRLQEAIINTTELVIISTTPDGTVNSFNVSAEKLLGYSGHELIDKSNALTFFELEEVIRKAEIFAAIHQITVEPVFDFLTLKVKSGKDTERTEWTMVRKDGSKFPALVSLSALHDSGESVMGFVLIITDLTEQKKNEEIAALNEQKFRILAENIPGVIYLCQNDAQFTTIYVNDHIQELTGYSAEEFQQGKIDFSRIFHPEDAEMIHRKVNEALAAKRSFHIRYRLRHRSGEWRWVEEVGIGVYAGKKLLMLEGFIKNITDQHLAEQSLKKIADENLKVFNSPVNLHAVAGFDGYFKRLSNSWTTFLGWTAEELTEKPFVEFVHPEDALPTREAMSKLFSGETVNMFENRYQSKDGSYRWLLWGSTPDVKNKLIYASAIDITERKKSETELLHSKKSLESLAGKLQEQNRQLDEFAHIISHNLRSPVGNIQALVGLLDENSTVKEYKLIFEKLRNVAKNIGETMNDLMDTLKVRENTNIERSELRFKDVLDKTVQTLEGDLIMAEASVTFNFNDASTVYYPKAYLESIFQNLLSNAIKYRSTERRPTIHFETRPLENGIELRVSDNGLGIDLERFGDKLFGLHKTFHVHEDARGVGLFLIKTQVEAMGGSITAESKVNEGTTFILNFSQH